MRISMKFVYEQDNLNNRHLLILLSRLVVTCGNNKINPHDMHVSTQVFMAAFLLSSSRTETQRVAESGSDDTRHVTRLDAPSAERTVEERLKGGNSVPPMGVKGNAVATPSTARNANQKAISSAQQPKTISNQEQNKQRPQTFGLIGAGELTQIGAAHLMLRASITAITCMPPRLAQVQDEHVWYVSGLHLQGASWVADDTV
jgi:hypothetical protein